MLTLYYVRAEDQATDENADAYVWSRSPQHAAELCKLYWQQLSGGSIDDTKVLWVDKVPTEQPAEACIVDWAHIVRIEGDDLAAR